MAHLYQTVPAYHKIDTSPILQRLSDLYDLLSKDSTNYSTDRTQFTETEPEIREEASQWKQGIYVLVEVVWNEVRVEPKSTGNHLTCLQQLFFIVITHWISSICRVSELLQTYNFNFINIFGWTRNTYTAQ